MHLIAVLRLVIVVLALLTIKDIAYLYSPFVVPDAFKSHFSFFIAASIYLLILYVAWRVPRLILKINKLPLEKYGDDERSNIADILVFCSILYVSLTTLVEFLYVLTYWIFSDVSFDEMKVKIISYLCVFLLTLIPLRYSTALSNWLSGKGKW